MYLWLGLFAAAIVAADQLSKLWIVHNIALSPFKLEYWPVLQSAFGLSETALAELPDQIDMIPGVFHLTHTLNEGAAFSAFEGMRWGFVLIFAILTALIAYEIVKNTMDFTKFEWWCIAAVYGGGFGNMLDRVRFGFVIDMIEVEFMRFAVFNVADCFITCGCILLIAHLVFFNKDFWKEDGK